MNKRNWLHYEHWNEGKKYFPRIMADYDFVDCTCT